MITIQKSETADTRTCDYANTSKETLLASSVQHIGDVGAALAFFSSLITCQAVAHDTQPRSVTRTELTAWSLLLAHAATLHATLEETQVEKQVALDNQRKYQARAEAFLAQATALNAEVATLREALQSMTDKRDQLIRLPPPNPDPMDEVLNKVVAENTALRAARERHTDYVDWGSGELLAMTALDAYPIKDALPKSTSVVFRIHQLGRERDEARAALGPVYRHEFELTRQLAERTQQALENGDGWQKCDLKLLEAERQLADCQRARIGDSEIIGRWQCQAEEAERQIAACLKLPPILAVQKDGAPFEALSRVAVHALLTADDADDCREGQDNTLSKVWPAHGRTETWLDRQRQRTAEDMAALPDYLKPKIRDTKFGLSENLIIGPEQTEDERQADSKERAAHLGVTGRTEASAEQVTTEFWKCPSCFRVFTAPTTHVCFCGSPLAFYGTDSSFVPDTGRTATAPFDFLAHLYRQREWSVRAFGPSPRVGGVIDHITKELREIEREPTDLSEWIDVAILALDGAWRAGHSPEAIIQALQAKQTKNETRDWPDWRTLPEDKAIEHVKEMPAPGRTGETPTEWLRHIGPFHFNQDDTRVQLQPGVYRLTQAIVFGITPDTRITGTTYDGSDVSATVTYAFACPQCGTKWTSTLDSPMDCARCYAMGTITVVPATGRARGEERTCFHCSGSGKVVGYAGGRVPCGLCKGTGMALPPASAPAKDK